MSAVGDAVRAGVLPGRVWLYSNYHCNLACTYCLTESAPSSPRRALGHERMLAVAEQARDLGFTDLGVTGGEPFLLPWMPLALADVARVLPTVILSNGTLFTSRRLGRLRALAGLPLAVQISLDSPDPDHNDERRGPGNFAKVVDAIPRLVELGIQVRIASTVEPGRLDEARHARLCALHRALGVPDEDHLVRPIIHRGRAVVGGMGTVIPHEQIPAELTVTVDGAFWSPFGPTVEGGRLDTDLLLTRTTDPLAVAAGALLRLVEGRPPGDDVELSIR